MELMQRKESFTLVELLIVIGILAILALAAVFVLNPAEFLAQSRDSNRMNDLRILEKAVNLTVTLGGAADLTEADRIYLSLPDTNADQLCDEYTTLPALPGSWEYRCMADAATLKNADGSGWLPIDLTSAAGFDQPLSALPIDPANNEANHYAYSKGAGVGEYSLFVAMESQKYEDMEERDGGSSSDFFETTPLSFSIAGGGNTWAKIGGDLRYGTIVATPDGGSITTGDIGGAVAYAKLDPSGALLWRKKMDMVNSDDLSVITRLADGNYLMAGSTENFGNGYLNQPDALLIKIDQDGNVIWAEAVGTSNNEEEFYSVYPTSDNGFIATGEVWGSSTVMTDTLVAKFAADGSLTWARRLSGPTHDNGNGVIEAGGSYVVVGTDTYDTLVLAKFNSDGSTGWIRALGTTSTNDLAGAGIVAADDGNYVVAGDMDNIDGGYDSDIFIAKFSSANGDALWWKRINDGSEDYATATSLLKDGSGYVIGGAFYAHPSTDQDGALVKVDASGSLVWSKAIGEEDVDVGDYIWSMAQTSGYYTVFGYDDDDVDSMFMKFDSSWGIENCSFVRPVSLTSSDLLSTNTGISFNVFSFSPPVITFTPTITDEMVSFSSTCPI